MITNKKSCAGNNVANINMDKKLLVLFHQIHKYLCLFVFNRTQNKKVTKIFQSTKTRYSDFVIL